LQQLGFPLSELSSARAMGTLLPEFRLPKSIVKGEVDNLRRMGVEFEHEKRFDAVFVVTGALDCQCPRRAWGAI
jgi:hypothetical protein